jgi:hypothetical protein
MTGAPGLDFQTWDTSALNPVLRIGNGHSVPHSFAGFLANEWDTSTLPSPRTGLNQAIMTDAPGLDFQTWDTSDLNRRPLNQLQTLRAPFIRRLFGE